MAGVLATARILGEPLVPTARLWDALAEYDEHIVRPSTAWWESMGQSGPVRREPEAPRESGVMRISAADLDWEDEEEAGRC